MSQQTPPTQNHRFKKLSILMAAYQEEATLQKCVRKVLSVPLQPGIERELIIVDDASTDRTTEIAWDLTMEYPDTVKVFKQDKNQGKGTAIRRAIKEMTGDLAVIQDADLEYDPNDYRVLLQPILDGKADVVYGSRFIGDVRKVLYFWHSMGNRFLTLLSNMFCDINLTDMETCYKAFRAECIQGLPLYSKRFGIEPEITAKISKNRFRIYEVPISYNGRTYEDGKKIGWKDGVAALWFILKYRLSSDYADSGKMALDALEQAPKFNQWMYEAVKPHLGKRIVELGAGRGNLSKLLKNHGEIFLAELRDEYLEELRERWEDLPGLTISKFDLTKSEDYNAIKDYKPDTVVCLNVLEHIEHDQEVLIDLNRALPEGAKIVFLVPYNPKLYSTFDKEIGHWRRYKKRELEDKMEKAGFKINKQYFFNHAGVWAWWLRNTLMGQKTITAAQLKTYNRLVPIFKIIDRILPFNGLSTIAVSTK